MENPLTLQKSKTTVNKMILTFYDPLYYILIRITILKYKNISSAAIATRNTLGLLDAWPARSILNDVAMNHHLYASMCVNELLQKIHITVISPTHMQLSYIN